MPILCIRRRFRVDMDSAGIIVMIPDRYSVTPPELPADTPILNVIDPMLKGLDPALRSKSDLTGRNRLAEFPVMRGYFRNHCSLSRGSIGTPPLSL